MTQQENNTNPLQQYFRKPKIWVKVPSGTGYYLNGEVEFNETGELGIMAMTANDELIGKNPDALLNGDAIPEIITSCVPGVKNAKMLLGNDIDALMFAIRHATYGEGLEVNTPCPECDHKNEFMVDLSVSIANMGMLDDVYAITTEDGVSIHVKPYSYKDTVHAMQIQFDQMKIARALESDDVSEDKKLKIFSKSYMKIATTNVDLMNNSIIKIMIGEDAVTDKKHIAEFLANLDKTTFGDIQELLVTVNNVGMTKVLKATCQSDECDHEWDAGIDFNPVTFFTDS